MDLLIMNPGLKGRTIKRRRRKNPARKSRAVGVVSTKGNKVKVTVKRRKRRSPSKKRRKTTVKRRKSPVKRRKAAPKRRKTIKRRRKTARKNPTTARRRKARKNPGTAKKRRKTKRTPGRYMKKARKYTRARPKAKSKKARQRKSVAGAYVRARGISHGVKSGRITGKAKRMATAMGLAKINPSNKAIFKDVKTLLPVAGVAIVATLGGLVGGVKLGNWAATKLPAATPAFLVNNMVPITTGGLTLVAFAALKKSKKMQKWAMPILVGGGIATALQMLLTTAKGQELAAKMGLPITSLGGYMEVPGYLGAYGAEIPPGASFYGRRDLADYVDAGPQNAFGGYVENDFPVHSPGPGDNEYNMATLGELIETPGGTMFGGASSISGRSAI